MPGGINIRIRRLDRVTVMELEGPLHLGPAVDRFSTEVKTLLEEGQRTIVIQMAGVPKMDSSGIGALVRLQTSASAAGGKLILCNVTPLSMQLLKMVRLDTVFPIFSDEASAVAFVG